ncbi:MAG: 2-dehydropantoate 2-reductase [Ahrensia sp.]|nr:2-dehydropantoate 2-reductase [Ahrensia sp.]
MRVAIAGAGSIGCYVGGILQTAGVDVTFIGRPSMAQRFARDGLHLQTLEGVRRDIDAGDLNFATDPAMAKDASHVLVCVKSMATADIAKELRPHLSSEAVLVSLQNGLDNATTLQAALPDHRCLAGMVAFNVVQQSGNRFAATTEGGIYVERDASLNPISDALNRAGIDCTQHDAMNAVQWSKLLLNLNNALNALSGDPLAAQLRNRGWRRLLAACVSEGLSVAKAKGIAPVKIGKVKPGIIPFVLRLPDFLFERVAAQMLKVDPAARSSMADDLALGRAPEIDYLNGAIVRHGRELGVVTPVNQRVCEAVKHRFEKPDGPAIDPNTLL